MTGPDHPPGDPADPTIDSLRAQWDQIIARVLDEGNLELGAALAACDPSPGRNGALVLAVPMEHRAWLAEGHPHRERLEALLNATVGSCPRIQLESRYREGRSGQQGDARQQRYRDAQNQPLVQELLRRFDADIISREPSARDAFLQGLNAGAADEEG